LGRVVELSCRCLICEKKMHSGSGAD
jgi:hypothetical protein